LGPAHDRAPLPQDAGFDSSRPAGGGRGVRKRLPPLCRPPPQARRPKGAPTVPRHRYGPALPPAAAPAEMLRGPRPQARRLPGVREGGEGLPEPAHLPGIVGFAGRVRRGHDRRVQRLVMPAAPETHRRATRAVAAPLGGSHRALEAARLLLACAAGFIAVAPFLHDGIMGGVDAQWYTSVVADHLEQWRMGLRPVFVGQTRFAAIGAVM